MADIAAVPIAEVLGSQISDDGQFALVNVSQDTGTQIDLGIARSALLHLIDHSALCKEQSDRIRDVDPALKEGFTASWWEISMLPDESLVLTLTFGLGGKLSFILPVDMPHAILETLQAYIGTGSMPTASKGPTS